MRHSGSGLRTCREPGCHSGTAWLGRAAAGTAALAVLALPAGLAAQTPALEVALRSGTVLTASAITGDPATGCQLRVAGSTRAVRGGQLLAVHGCPVGEVDLAVAWLHGGEMVRGALVGGDTDGNSLFLLSPVLGTVTVPVDRLLAFVPPGHVGLGPADLPLPTDVHEALVTQARIGRDLAAGSLHRFTNRGVRFAREGSERAVDYGLRDFVAVRIADPLPRAATPQALLLTRTGDRLGVAVREFAADGVVCELESGRSVEVSYADLACLSFLGAGIYLSDLDPVEVVEAGHEAPVLYPFRRDRSVTGGPLSAAGRAHGKGLGVHSRSRLSYVVPEGVGAFWARVALDDSASALPFRAEVDVRVLRAGEVVFERRGLAAGRGACDVGLQAVAPGEMLTLEVDFGKGRDLGDRVDWLSAVFLPAPRR